MAKRSYSTDLIGSIKQALSGLQGYDIMVLELIQNADDAHAQKIKFDICDDALNVFNDQKFSACSSIEDDDCSRVNGKMCDFHALSKFASAHKSSNSENIGRFGIGFVAVYQITDEPIICSNGIEFTLTPLTSDVGIEKDFSQIQGTHLRLPWAINDSKLRDALDASPITKETICDDILENVQNVGENCLFFLKNLKSIKILRNGKLIQHIHVNYNNSKIRLISEPDGKIEDRYCIEGNINKYVPDLKSNFRALDKLKRNTNLQIAFDLDTTNENKGLIFSYLPTTQGTNMQCHINADFFPEQDRKSIIISGKGHEKHWNDTLLKGAAEVITENLSNLRDKLGYKGFWQLLEDAHGADDQEYLKVFWSHICPQALQIKSVWSHDKRWVSPGEVVIANDNFSHAERNELTSIGLNLVHQDIAKKSQILDIFDVRNIMLADVIEKMELNQKKIIKKPYKKIAKLYSIIDKLCQDEEENDELKSRLKQIKFIYTNDGGYLCIDELYRLPSRVKLKDMPDIFLKLPLVNEKIKTYQNLYTMIPELSFEALGNELSNILKTPTHAEKMIGKDSKILSEFYNFLASYKSEKMHGDSTWESIPLIFTKNKFWKTQEVILPEDFNDPFDDFQILNMEYFDKKYQEKISKLFKKTFGIKRYSIKDYIRNRLKDDIEREISDSLYSKIILELVKGDNKVINNSEMKKLLKEMPLAKTEDGNLVLPCECYFKSPQLVKLLGDKKSLWLDESKLPKKKEKLARQFFKKLGTAENGDKINCQHVIERIKTITESPPNLQNIKIIEELLDFLISKYPRKKDDMEELKTLKWLPAKFRGIASEQWHSPCKIFHPKPASIFDSHVAILDIHKSKLDIAKHNTFFKFLCVQYEPTIEILVKHIEYCKDNNKKLLLGVYDILSKLYKNEMNSEYIDPLRNMACIYNKENNKYFMPRQVFWNSQKLGKYRSQAPKNLADSKPRKDFLNILGIKEKPQALDYKDIILESCNDYQNDLDLFQKNIIYDIQYKCLIAIALAYHDEHEEYTNAVSSLRNSCCIITKNSTLEFPHKLAFADKDEYEKNQEIFEDKLDSFLVENKHELTQYKNLLKELGIKALSSIIKTTLCEYSLDGKREQESLAEQIKDRIPIIDWLLNEQNREEIKKRLSEIKIFTVIALEIQYEFILSDPSISSAPVEVYTFFNKESNTLYVQENIISKSDRWMYIFKALFDDNYNTPFLTFVLNEIMEKNQKDAIRTLESAGFSRPPLAYDEFDDSHLINKYDYLDDETAKTPDIIEAREETSQKQHHRSQNSNSQDKASGKFGVRVETPPQFGENVRTSASSFNNNNKGGSIKNSYPLGNTPKQSRLISYVLNGDSSNYDTDDNLKGHGIELKNSIDSAAMRAVIQDLNASGFNKIEPKKHHNKGHDIMAENNIMFGNGNDMRIIEVKGLRNRWTEKGITISQAQMETAYKCKLGEFKGEFWLYVVEYALGDIGETQIYKIKNPFAEIKNFFFDHNWSKLSEKP